MGWWSAMVSCFYLSANSSLLDERVDDSDSIDELAVPQVFGKKDAAGGLLCGVHDQRVPAG